MGSVCSVTELFGYQCDFVTLKKKERGGWMGRLITKIQ